MCVYERKRESVCVIIKPILTPGHDQIRSKCGLKKLIQFNLRVDFRMLKRIILVHERS